MHSSKTFDYREQHLHETFQSERQRLAYEVLHTSIFDFVMGSIIIFNFYVVIVETDYSAEHDGETLAWTDATGWLILVIFVVELILRLYVYRMPFFKDGWNIFDFAIVS